MAKECLACGKTIGMMTARVPISDGQVCTDCWDKTGMERTMQALKFSKQYTGATIKEMIAAKERNQALVANFKATKNVGVLSFDDNTQTFVITKSKKEKVLYYYNQVVSFELLEDGESITRGGLGRAAVGGLLFGGVGAIVGGVTGGKKTKGICTSLQIKLTLRNSTNQTEYVSYISTDTPRNSPLYKKAYLSAQDGLSALQLALETVDTSTTVESPAHPISGADEILKYKGLLDAGIITEEEFNAKKAQILGL